MHELSLAQGLVSWVKKEVENQRETKAVEIHVAIGELMQLEESAFVQSANALLRGPRLEGATLSVRREEASFACNRCSAKFEMAKVKHQLDDVADDLKIMEPDSQELPLHFLPQLYSAFIKCPECGSSDVHLERGGDIRVEKLVME